LGYSRHGKKDCKTFQILKKKPEHACIFIERFVCKNFAHKDDSLFTLERSVGIVYAQSRMLMPMLTNSLVRDNRMP
jgi:hypothetical protein